MKEPDIQNSLPMSSVELMAAIDISATSPKLCERSLAGNVIGGGDWSENRILADAARAFSHNQPLIVRNPKATRPFQHVLEPISGYLRYVEQLSANPTLDRHFNFGPIPAIDTDVHTIAELAASSWGPEAHFELTGQPQDWHEPKTLLLDSQQAYRQLGWMPRLNVGQAVEWTMRWYRCALEKDSAALETLTAKQISDYQGSFS